MTIDMDRLRPNADQAHPVNAATVNATHNIYAIVAAIGFFRRVVEQKRWRNGPTWWLR